MVIKGFAIKRIFLFLLITGIVFGCGNSNKRELEMAKKANQNVYRELREQMVKKQIQARGVTDEAVLKAMRKVPRHLFVPEMYRDMAYQDTPLPIGAGQTISQPYIVAYMTQALNLKGNEKVLEIGTGSGYQAAILAEIVDEVYTIEIIPELATRAARLLKKLKYDNIFVKQGDGYKGWPEYAPFDAIIVTAAPEQIPQPLIDQLKENGRMVLPVGNEYQDLILVTKKDGKVHKQFLLPVRFVPMVGEAEKQ
ncbi:protein-L-isoaspartate O-methyltransferase [candidate division KSB1 bacterium]|nr:MAG: protein-L-isoaspartate O-methyltransferase [candidate division KSB1 bacterium 4484_219]RKY77139.1 MAG: protein-L-isoaspartate O-methyltransferase [candidate division KSB1 bacterium]HDI51088.1 protein-L-isoaspartate(D-aspartate) O-methyltransferase [Bacteroidota bacterium]RKY84790.1 MAG: protein-L-isoaspartate O-methyltransferase [candidate division KSB1 bacterium]RKY88959.1 MAG: protein-L-isoaspartate O-methyltransferase [candidate division KSB1 bacterium]